MGVRQQRHGQHITPRPVSFSRPPDHTLTRLVGRLCDVIRIEEREVARAGGARMEVTQAARCGRSRAPHQYRLALGRQQPNLRVNGDITLLRPNGDPVPGRVVRVRGRLVWVATEDLGEDLSGLAVRSEVDWLWAAVRNRLRALWPSHGRGTPGSVRPQHDLIVDLLNARSRKRALPASGASANGILNREQREAVRAILANAVTYLWGPPGTGKTTTLAAAVEGLVSVGRTALVVAPSNAAADVIARRIAWRLSTHAAFDYGLVARHGSGVSRQLRSRWGDRLVPEDVAHRLERESTYTCGPNPQRHADRAASLEAAIASLSAKSGAAMCPLLMETGRRVVRSSRLRACAPHSTSPARSTPEQIMRGAAVVVTTAHQLCFENAAVRMYDTVIVDEAGQASLPLVLLAAAHAREAVVVAGDPRQLPPTVQAREPRVKRLLGEDVFTLSGAISLSGSGPTHMLVEQHRMAPEISALVSAVWYGGKLRPHASVMARPQHPVARRRGSLLFVDTRGFNARVARTDGDSRVNWAHVEVVRRLVADLDAKKLLPRSTSVLITSPFKAQAARVTRGTNRFSASTVHAVQGGEADVVVLDLTDAPGATVSQFLSAARIEEEGGRLLNVAASRARHALIVVADFTYLKTHGGKVVREFLRRVETAGNTLALPAPLPTPGGVQEWPSGLCRPRRVR